MRATRLTLPALGASLVLLLGACGDDGPSRADDPAADASPSETTSETSDPSSAPAVLLDFGDEPAVEASYKEAALQAVGDELITMVPSALPDGWSTAGGGYQPEPQWWHMEYTAPSGAVTLDQFAGDTDAVLGDLGLASSGDVDLSAWGTGSWSAWDNDGAAVLTHELKGSTVVLQGADQDTVTDLAKSLIPAEDAPAGQNG